MVVEVHFERLGVPSTSFLAIDAGGTGPVTER